MLLLFDQSLVFFCKASWKQRSIWIIFQPSSGEPHPLPPLFDSPLLPTDPSTPFPSQEDLLDFEGEEEEDEEEEEETKDKALATPPAPALVSAPPPDATPDGVPPVGPWLAPPETAAAARVRLSLYFALCVKSRPMLAGLLDAYVTATPAAQDGLKAELPLLARAAAKGFGEAGVVGLVAASPVGAKPLALLMLDLLVPRDTNKPSPEMVAAVRRLRETRLLAEAKEEVVKREEEGGKVGVVVGGVSSKVAPMY